MNNITLEKLPFDNSFPCGKCGRIYRTKYTQNRHERYECGKPAKFNCSQCDFRSKHKHNLKQHFDAVHKMEARQDRRS